MVILYFIKLKKGMVMRNKKSILCFFLALFQMSACYAVTNKCNENLGVDKYYGGVVSVKESSVFVLDDDMNHICGVYYRFNKVISKGGVDITQSIPGKAGNFNLVIDNQYKSDMCARILTTAHNGWKIDYIEVCYLDTGRQYPRLVGMHAQGGLDRNK